MDARTLGDYRLTELLAEKSDRATWLGEQASVGRPVVVIELRDLAKRERFLEIIRAKAAVDQPMIGSVYEAVSEDDHCFAAFERLPGTTLAQRLDKGSTLKPFDLAHLLRRLAETQRQLEDQGLATDPTHPENVYLDSHGVVRLENLARPGEREPDASEREIRALGESLPPLVSEGLPGASRVLTVLAWMRGEGLGRPITWEQVRSYAEQIESQLLESQPGATGPRTARAESDSRSPLPLVISGAVALVAVVLGLAILLRGNGEEAIEPEPQPLPPPVTVAAGSHPTPDGGTQRLPAFRISAGEVTIGEYLEFLEVLEELEPGDRGVFDLEGQPETKDGHRPDDWPAMLAAAREGGTWNGRPINLLCPIVNIDWWDAAAYCEWRGCRLPTQEEWFAALRQKLDDPATLQAAVWGPVPAIDPADRTPNGLLGMAGSVAEWTRRPATNPANPLGKRQYVIIGGSFLEPGAGALQRQWTDDRLQRRPDLGFRVVHPSD